MPVRRSPLRSPALPRSPPIAPRGMERAAVVIPTSRRRASSASRFDTDSGAASRITERERYERRVRRAFRRHVPMSQGLSGRRRPGSGTFDYVRPLSILALAAVVTTACMPARHAAPPLGVLTFPRPVGPSMPTAAPWHAGLKPCSPPAAYLAVKWDSAGDIDGDGRADFLETTCDGVEHECVMQLCVGTDAGFAYAAAWRAPDAESIVALAGRAPRDFEGYSVEPAFPGGPACAHGRRFTWDASPGEPGYLATSKTRCGCAMPASMMLPKGCYRARP